MFGRQARQPLAQLVEDRLARRRKPADLRRVHADEQLQIRPRGEVLARLHEPLEHVGKRIRRIVKLRVPRHVRQQPDDRLRRIEAELTRDRRCILQRGPVKHNPVEHPFAPAAKVLHQLAILRRRQLLVLPVLARLGHQRVMVRVVVAEDEPALAVRHVPGRDVHALLPRHFADDPPRHVDAVREDRRRKADRSDQAPGGERRQRAPPRDTAAAPPPHAARRPASRSRRTEARRRGRARRWPGRRA